MIVYIATNKVNGKVYIGQTINRLDGRRKSHEWSARNGSNFHFHRALRKYGIENFLWDELYSTNNLSDLNDAEEYFINEYNARVKGYNMAFGGSNRLHTPEILAKISKGRKGKTVGKDNPFYGKKHTDRTKNRISKANKGRPSAMLGRKHSGETKTKMRMNHCDVSGENNPRLDNKIYAFRHPDYGMAFCRRYDLNEEFKLPRTSLWGLVHGKRKIAHGWSLVSPEYLEQLRKEMGEIICRQ